MNRIVVASDLSKRSDRAVARAIALACATDASLTILHVVDSSLPMHLAESVAQSSRRKLGEVQATCDLAITIHVTAGDPAHDIPDIVDQIDADLLVLGVHRRRSRLDMIRETTMERLIRLTGTPALLVADPVEGSYRRLLAAVDMSQACAATIRQAHTLAPKADLRLFHAFKGKKQGAADTKYAHWRARSDLPEILPEPTIIKATPAKALARMLEADKPDLLLVGAHTRSGIGRYFLGGFVAGLVRDPPCDLLVGRDKQ